jgi:hypothetical protein
MYPKVSNCLWHSRCQQLLQVISMNGAMASVDGIISNQGTSEMVWTQVTEDDIEKYHTAYRGSEEERSDLLQHYERFQGNMDQVKLSLQLLPMSCFSLRQSGRCRAAESYAHNVMQSIAAPHCCEQTMESECDLPRQVLEWQICSEPKRDSHRFMDAIEAAITEVPDATNMRTGSDVHNRADTKWHAS